ncbi:MAG TPA: hypothetical protein VI319_07145 [Burkholderiales bacterium]
MNITSEYLADLLIGIARAQNAIVEAIERAEPGFRSTHLLPVLTVAANMRTGDPRAIDLASRILLRLQGRVALDNAQVKADIERLATEVKKDAVAFTPPQAPRAAGPATQPGSDLDFSTK